MRTPARAHAHTLAPAHTHACAPFPTPTRARMHALTHIMHLPRMRAHDAHFPPFSTASATATTNDVRRHRPTVTDRKGHSLPRVPSASRRVVGRVTEVIGKHAPRSVRPVRKYDESTHDTAKQGQHAMMQELRRHVSSVQAFLGGFFVLSSHSSRRRSRSRT
jgi:hypothetical protein